MYDSMNKPIYVAFSTQKGGAGKTTITALVASYLHYVKGYNVAVVDCDFPQYSIHDMRRRDMDTTMKDEHYKAMAYEQPKRLDKKAYPVLCCKPEDAAETAAKAAKLGIRVLTNARTGKHTFSVYEGRDLTAGNTAGNAPCIFSQEFDNIVEQEYTNSVENLKTTAYVGGEEKEGVTRKVAEVGGSSTGLSRDEVFINATDIVQEYENESGQTVTLTNAQYLALLSARGVEELEQYAETLAFGSKINTNANLKYGTDYDLGDRVTCINKRWNVRIDVRITEIAETYETSGEEIDITFGESLPALLTQIRQITK